MTGEQGFAASTSASSDLSQQSSTPAPKSPGARFWPLALGSVGVVYGDIGTSPIYAFRQALAAASPDGVTTAAALGVVSLAIWALILVVTVKYVFFIMRLDNRGEGGVLSLMALAERMKGKRTFTIFALGIAGAALFYGDAMITPSYSVLSAVEGLRTIPVAKPYVSPQEIMIVTLVILVGLFAMQSRGTGRVGRWFGPICVVWFLVLAILGVYHLIDAPQGLMALNPLAATSFLIDHPAISLFVLGAVFLTVTGAEALYADMGHFGRKPIAAAWIFLVLPCLMLNYLGQGAMALKAVDAAHGARVENADWFFLMAPEIVRAPLVLLATIATVIASQAVITGAFSITSQAIQMGLLPRLVVRNTSEHEAGQVFLPAVNGVLLIGVVMLVAIFKNSDALAHAYGLAVTGTVLVTTSLSFFVVRGLWKWPLWKAILIVSPAWIIDFVFLGANALKIPSGGFLSLMVGCGVVTIMAVWVRGREIIQAKAAKEATPRMEVVGMLDARPPKKVPGVAVFLTSDPDGAPMALMHNLKHNRILHERNIILTVNTAPEPRIPAERRLTVEQLSPDFWRVNATWGYMESPDVPKALAACRK